MRVCLILCEFFAWGKYGGFGSMVRGLANGLRKQGIDVWVIAPRRRGQREPETVDGLTVLGYPGREVLTTDAYGLCDADIYHYQEATIATDAAIKAIPTCKMGFGVPLGMWFRGPLYRPAVDLLLTPGAKNHDYFGSQPIHHLIEGNRDGRADHGKGIWGLLMFERWLRQYQVSG